MSNDDFLTVSEAARALGVSSETVRRYEAQGLLGGERTPGGQRRFRRAAVERLRTRGGASSVASAQPRDPAPGPAVEAKPVSSVPAPVPTWEARRANAEANLDVTRAEIARRLEIRQYREEQRAREEAARALERDRAAAARAVAETRAAAARAQAEREQAAQKAQSALDNCVAIIRIRIAVEPSAVRAEVERYLADNARVGVPLDLIEAECAAILDRHHAAIENEQRGKSAQAMEAIRRAVQLHQLVSHGESYARGETRSLTFSAPSAALEAREAVRRRLAEVVDADWTELDVEQEVDEVLSEWV